VLDYIQTEIIMQDVIIYHLEGLLMSKKGQKTRSVFGPFVCLRIYQS